MTKTVDYEIHRGEVIGRCPNCGNAIGLDAAEPENVERHPATPEDEPVTCHCQVCDPTVCFKVKLQ